MPSAQTQLSVTTATSDPTTTQRIIGHFCTQVITQNTTVGGAMYVGFTNGDYVACEVGPVTNGQPSYYGVVRSLAGNSIYKAGYTQYRFVYRNGTYVNPSQIVMQFEYSATTRPWYKAGAAAGNYSKAVSLARQGDTSKVYGKSVWSDIYMYNQVFAPSHALTTYTSSASFPSRCFPTVRSRPLLGFPARGGSISPMGPCLGCWGRTSVASLCPKWF